MTDQTAQYQEDVQQTAEWEMVPRTPSEILLTEQQLLNLRDATITPESSVSQTPTLPLSEISETPTPATIPFQQVMDAMTISESEPPAAQTSTLPLPENLEAPPPGTIPPKRVVIFGETGTGKSSLINMIAGSTVAGVSNEAQGCTFGSQAHSIEIGDKPYILWDTAGLNEGDRGSVPAEQAIRNLQQLIHDLKSDGVSLLVYCIRGTRFRDIVRVNYDLFYRIICQSKVPIVAVITCLEHESPMEKWWEENKEEFGRYGLEFKGHACITTTRGKKTKTGEFMFEEEYDQSQELVRKLVEDSASPDLWRIGDWPSIEQMGGQVADYYQRYNDRDEQGRFASGPYYSEGLSRTHPHHGLMYFILTWITSLPIIREVVNVYKATHTTAPPPSEPQNAPHTTPAMYQNQEFVV